MNNQDIDQNDLNSLNMGNTPSFTTTPEPQPIIPQAPPTPPKKSKKGLIIVLIAIFLVVTAGVVALFVFAQPKATQSSNQTTSSSANSPETPIPEDTTDFAKILIDKVKTSEAALISKHPTIKVEQGKGYAVDNKYESNKYYIGGDFIHSVTTTTDNPTESNFSEDAIAAANTALASDTTLTKNVTDTSTVYQNSLVVCSFSTVAGPLSVLCANKRDYAPVAEKIKPFAEALFLAQGEDFASRTILYEPKITEKTEGYSNATMTVGAYESVGGYLGLFYGKDGKWLFWKGVQALVPCSEYNSPALQYSFAGDKCYDEATNKEDVVKITFKQ